MSDSHYYFPFERLSPTGRDRIYIFGAGLVGSQLQKQIDEHSGFINLGFLDNYATAESVEDDAIRRVGIQKPGILATADYDYVVLACSYWQIPEFCECLFKIGVDSRKILTVWSGNARLYSETPDMGNKWNDYYDIAEKLADGQIEDYFVPIIDKHKILLERVLDFPSGRGRIAEGLRKKYKDAVGSIVCCDANAEAIDFCRKRFSGDESFGFVVNTVDARRCTPFEFPDNDFSFIYSWDAMVHFTYKWLDFYVGEFYRVLKDGGFVLLHHSNLGSPDVDIGFTKSENWIENPHGRTPISYDDISFISERYGFKVIGQKIIDCVIPKLDCITVLAKSERLRA